MPDLTPSSESERRTQARLSAQVPIQVHVGDEATTRPATLIDLSWGGALLQTPAALAIGDQPIRLLLPWTAGETIRIEAQILRQKNLENDRHLSAVRFRRLSLSDQTRLEKLLGLIQGGDSKRQALRATPLVATLEVLIETIDEWRRALTEISQGRLQISTPTAFTSGQSLGIQFNGVPARARLRLRARVLVCQARRMSGLGTVQSHTLNLEFEHPLEPLRQWALWLLNQIPASSETSPPPDYQRRVTGLEAVSGRIVLEQADRSALEIGSPAAIDYLLTAWGDIEAFELVFQQLIFGDVGASGTWTSESWEELQFLQDLHAQAYGLSEARRSRLKVGRDVR